MSPVRKTSLPAENLDRPSRVQQVSNRILPVIPNVENLHPVLLKKIMDAVMKARRQIERIVANDDGQGMLFPEVPENYAEEIIRVAQLDLCETGIRLERTTHSIKIVADEVESETPRRAIGY
jgi:hypothetical protein